MSALGDCRSEFIFCNGMRPQLFQCKRPGDVFKDGECIPADKASCNVCQPGEMKRSTEKCEEVCYFLKIKKIRNNHKNLDFCILIVEYYF